MLKTHPSARYRECPCGCQDRLRRILNLTFPKQPRRRHIVQLGVHAREPRLDQLDRPTYIPGACS